MMSEKRIIYPKKLGILIPLCSAIALTIKLGPLPIYVIAPKNTEPQAIARNSITSMPVSSTAPASVGRPCATEWNATAVGELSRNAERTLKL